MNRLIMNTRPRLLLAYSDSAHASQCGRFFRRLGWEVRMVPCGFEARRQVYEFQPTILVVDADLPEESGWLTCAKIVLDRPQAKILVQVPFRDEESEKQVQFLGLDGLVSREEGVEGLAGAIMGQAVTQAVG